MGELVIRNIGVLYSPLGNDILELENASIRVENGVITEVAQGLLTPSTDEGEVLDAGRRIALPGFVDPHTHSVFAGDRSNELIMKLKGYTYLQILERGGGIAKTLRETRRAPLEELTRGLEDRLEEFRRHGITAIEIKSGYGMDQKTEIKQLEAAGMARGIKKRARTFLGAHIIPPEYRERREEYVAFLVDEMIPLVAEKGLADYVDVFCDEGVYTLDEAEEILKAGKRAGLRLKIHSDEIKNLGATRMAAELGATSADHLVLSEEEDLEAMARHGTVPVLLPGTVFTTFLPQYPNARKMLEMELPVALATDYNPNCPLQNPIFLGQLAVYKMKMLPEEVLRSLTINAARAINMEEDVGSIEVGKRGDIVLLNSRSLTEVFYRIGHDPVWAVIEEGEVVFRR